MTLSVAADSSQPKLPFSFKIKRAAKISIVVAGIIFVSLAIQMLILLNLSVYAMNRHLDPDLPRMMATGTSAMLMIFGIAKFFTALWEIEDEAWRRPVSPTNR
jgi:hypothetical protein